MSKRHLSISQHCMQEYQSISISFQMTNGFVWSKSEATVPFRPSNRGPRMGSLPMPRILPWIYPRSASTLAVWNATARGSNTSTGRCGRIWGDSGLKLNRRVVGYFFCFFWFVLVFQPGFVASVAFVGVWLLWLYHALPCFTYLSIYLSIYLPTYLSIYLPIYLSIFLSI